MNGMKRILLILLLFIQMKSQSQTGAAKFNFNYKVQEAVGDLNKDGLQDKAIVTQDTSHETEPYRLQIFLATKDGGFKLYGSYDKIIIPRYPDGDDGYRTGEDFSEITISKGILTINCELLRGYYEHKFRFQNGHFELIGFKEVSSDGNGNIFSQDYNLSTGDRIEEEERIDSNKVLRRTKKKILLRPLPRLQDIIPRENEYY